MIYANLGHMQRWRTLLPPPSLFARRPIALGHLSLRVQTYVFVTVLDKSLKNDTPPRRPRSTTQSAAHVTRQQTAFPHEPLRGVGGGLSKKIDWAPEPEPEENEAPSTINDISYVWEYDGLPPSPSPKIKNPFTKNPPPPPRPLTKDWKAWKQRYLREVRVHRQAARVPHRLDERPTPEGEIPEIRMVGDDTMKTVFNRWKKAMRRAHSSVGRYGKQDEPLSDLLKLDTAKEMSAAWKKVPENERVHEFINQVILATKSVPEKIPMVIEALLPITQPPPPHFVLEDILRQIANQAHANFQNMDMPSALSCVRTVLRNTWPEYVRLDQDTLFKVIGKGDQPGILALYHDLQNYDHLLSGQTLQHLVSRLAGGRTMEAKREALLILEQLQKRGGRYNINNGPGRRIATLLLSDRTDGTTNHRPAELMQRLLALGSRPNRITYTALIQSLTFGGELETAWMVYRNMEEQGIIPDSILIQVMIAASAKANNLDSVVQALALTGKTPILEEYGWNLLLYTILHWRQPGTRLAERAPTRFQLLMAALCKIFDPQPLHAICDKDLGDLLDVDALDIDSELGAVINGIPRFVDRRQTPKSTTLRIMLVGYIRSLPEPNEVLAFYARFDELLKRGHPAVLALVEGDRAVVYNTIMLSLSYSSTSRPAVFNVMRSLLEDNPMPLQAHVETSEYETPRRPRPDKHSWNIVLDAILRNGDFMQAARHLRQMQSYGVEPNQATWNIQVRGHARMQNAERTVDTLRKMEEAGFEADRFTINAFGSLRNKEVALDMLESFMSKREMHPYVGAGDPHAGKDLEWLSDPVAAEFDNMYKELTDEPTPPIAEATPPIDDWQAMPQAPVPTGGGQPFEFDGWNGLNLQYKKTKEPARNPDS
ncbi:hypothetical protein RB598_004528 [Gaeumannomyces tritici]